ncbi:hypothetical protein A5644_10120 [Mycobacterium intracellulare subsp. yongonense]|nr:hypothetical protein A5644_10120 [Mycobacterium intracellulare subsp. yongonense]
MVDSLDAAVGRRRRGDRGRVLGERVAYSGYGGSDFAGDLLIQAHQLCGALTKVAGEGLGCRLPGGPLGD